MEASMRAALTAWEAGDPLPLVRLFGFRPNGRACDEFPASLGRAGECSALLLRCSTGDAVAQARRARNADPLHHHLFLARSDDPQRLELIAFGLDGEPRRLVVDLSRLRSADLETLCEMVAQGEQGLALALRHTRALDRARVTHRFFVAFRAMRARIAAEWRGIPATRRPERERLALLFLCRLMFLYFLERDGRLAGRTDYFRWLRRRYARRQERRSFYRAVLTPLFFGALNRRPERRTAGAQRLGRLPYLNGGLFERDALERRYPQLDLPVTVTDAVFDELLERYRFTTREHAAALQDDGADGAVDPEMLGRVFEGLMDADDRSRTGTFFTPAPLVDEVVRHALAARIADRCGTTVEQADEWLRMPHAAPAEVDQALDGLRVLDPACGSGAFLLGLLTRMARIRRARGADADLTQLVGDALHGVDVQDDAALLCALRLWLALAAGAGRAVPPLPNLDRRIRQGDALLDPLELHAVRSDAAHAAVIDRGLRSAIAALSCSARAYLLADPEARGTLSRRIDRQERALADRWASSQLRQLAYRERELSAAAEASDLFGERLHAGHPLRAQLQRLRTRQSELKALRARLRRRRGVPFFSFIVHFADAMQDGFDVVVSNPPWVRAHRWPQGSARLIRERYATCASPGWRYGTECVGVGRGVAAQVDLAMLFLELGLRVLKPGGIIAMLLPAKLLRSLFAAGARRLLLEQADVIRIDDRSLDTHASFAADAFVATVVARRKCRPEQTPPDVRVTLHRRNAEALSTVVKADDLPLVHGDSSAPWLLAPTDVRRALRTMQRAGAALGRHSGLRVRRGIMTGANEVMVLRRVEPRLGGLCAIQAIGSRADNDAYNAIVESACVRRLLRGADIRAWHCTSERHVLWLYDEHLRLRAPPPRLVGRYLERHARQLDTRASNASTGRLFRISGGLLESMVLWRDLAPRLDAVALPRAADRPVPLNSVYFVALGRDDDAAFTLTAYLNSLPMRVFARAIAERAKDAFFRFFAWTVAVLPLPGDWHGTLAGELCRLARDAHEAGGMDAESAVRLDALVARSYGLGEDDLRALTEFDAWLSGATT